MRPDQDITLCGIWYVMYLHAMIIRIPDRVCVYVYAYVCVCVCLVDQ